MAELWQTGSPLSSKFLVETTKDSRQSVTQHLRLVPYGLTRFSDEHYVLWGKNIASQPEIYSNINVKL